MATPQDVENNTLIRKLREWNPEAVAETIRFRGELTIVVPPEHLRRTAEFLRGSPDFQFSFLSDITGVDCFPDEPRFELNYHLLSLNRRERLRLKVRVGSNNPGVESVTSIWPGANWHEREVFDLFGVRFEGHPDLRRILMPEDWEGHPLRKDYPVEGYR
jgi:NADH-quinone oxidoreductase subunit C